MSPKRNYSEMTISPCKSSKKMKVLSETEVNTIHKGQVTASMLEEHSNIFANME